MLITERVRAGSPTALRVGEALLGVLGATALGGGVTMIADPGGGLIGMPAAWVKDVPLISDWLVPGIVLALWFGVGSLLTLLAMIRRLPMAGTQWMEDLSGRHWTWAATIILGATQVAWIAVELVFMPQTMWIQGVMAAVGAAMVIAMLTPGARRALSVQ